MTVTCSGSACSGTPQGRFDAFFASGATSGFAQIFVGNSNGEIDVFAGFNQSSAIVAADARAAIRGIQSGVFRAPVPMTAGIGGARFLDRTR